MKITTRNTISRRTWAIFIAGIIVLLLAVGSAAYFMMNKNPSSAQATTEKIDLNAPTKEQKEAGEMAKEESIKRAQSANGQNSPAYNPVQITARYESASEGLTIASKLSNDVSWSNCKLKLENDGIVRQYSARAVYQSDYSFCGGFTVPSSELRNGTWQVALTVTDINGKAYEKTTSVDIRI